MPNDKKAAPVDVPLDEIYAIPGISILRDTFLDIYPLYQSVRKEGIRNPVRLIPREEGGYYLVDGYRRCHAAIMSRWETVPAFVENLTLEQFYDRTFTKAPLVLDANLHRIRTDSEKDFEPPQPKHNSIIALFGKFLRKEGKGRHKSSKHRPER